MDLNCILKVFKDQYVAVGMMQNKERRKASDRGELRA